MCFTRCFCCFSPKTGICCHPAATKNVPKYWCYRRLVAGWQQNLNFITITKRATQFTTDWSKSNNYILFARNLYIFRS